MGTLRIRYRERELDVEAEDLGPWNDAPSSGAGGGVLAVVGTVTRVAFVAAWWTATEVLCLVVAGVGMVGRVLDVTGTVAARRSWLLTAIHEITERPQALPVAAVPPPLPTLPRDNVRIITRD